MMKSTRPRSSSPTATATETRTSARKARRPPRDQDESAFTQILTALVARVPGAFAATLVDRDGECVDYAGDADPFDVKVAGAHWGIAVHEILQLASLGGLDTIVCRGAARSFIVRLLPDGYALVVLLTKRAGFASCARALDACERAMAQEAVWTLPKGRGVWIGVEVDTDERGRPKWLTMGALSCAVEVLGTFAATAYRSPSRHQRRERGFRVRLPSGGELNLVREPGNKWYADEKLG
ncbi:MAG TPA: roadblock/LC7 domain-containing protein [Polyangiaceae bacterium]|nr:roadblock/LC7 domain-containing protein [Polyangiaceae bacterium]